MTKREDDRNRAREDDKVPSIRYYLSPYYRENSDIFKNVLEKSTRLYMLENMKRSDITISLITFTVELI